MPSRTQVPRRRLVAAFILSVGLLSGGALTALSGPRLANPCATDESLAIVTIDYGAPSENGIVPGYATPEEAVLRELEDGFGPDRATPLQVTGVEKVDGTTYSVEETDPDIRHLEVEVFATEKGEFLAGAVRYCTKPLDAGLQDA